MTRCCYSDEYADLFREREARRTVRRFLRRGLRGSARRLADAVETVGGVEGATILEVGGGAGDIQAHLLRLGAARSANVELSPNWEPAAWWLAAELDLLERVDRRVADFVEVADELPDASLVILHRVVCCYPDWRAMLDAAVTRTQRVIALTVPVDTWPSRLAVRLGNRVLALRRRAFRAFVHPPDRMITALEAAGFALRVDRSGPVWRTIVAERRGA